MKKAIAYLCLLFIFVSQTQIGVIYAQETAKVEAAQDQNIEVLDKVEGVIGSVIEKLDDKVRNTEIKQQLQEKEAEIEAYIEETQEKIADESNPKEMKELVLEAKKTVVLKVIAGATRQEDVSDNISTEVADTPQEKEEALDTITDSLKTESGDYNILIKSKYSLEKIEKLFGKFDDDTELEFMYAAGNEDYYEVSLKEDSIFRKEMLQDIEAGILPESFIGIEIVLPEVFGLGASPIQDGENLDITWGIKNYDPNSYLGIFEGTAQNTQSLKIGVVDTGIDHGHPDLSGNTSMTLDYDFVNNDEDAMDDQGHGTHVAGTIGAQNNGSGIVGVNPNVNLVGLKICNYRGYCPSYAVIKALSYATEKKIDILNMSLGGRSDPVDHPICDAISNYTDKGGIVIAASGNSNIDTSRFVPGGCNEAITVAAVDENMTRASFSNYGTKVDVSAPGVNIYSTYPRTKGTYKKLSGTSMATPHIVGLVSLMKGIQPSIDKVEIKNLLQSESLTPTSTSGKGIAQYAVPEKVIAKMTAVTEEGDTESEKKEDSEEETQLAEKNGADIQKDISEYITEVGETYDGAEEITPKFISLDGIELSEIQSDESEGKVIEPKVFEITPTINLSEDIEINSFGENGEEIDYEEVTLTGSQNAIVIPEPDFVDESDFFDIAENEVHQNVGVIQEIVEENELKINTTGELEAPEELSGVQINNTDNTLISYEEQIETSQGKGIPKVVEITIPEGVINDDLALVDENGSEMVETNVQDIQKVMDTSNYQVGILESSTSSRNSTEVFIDGAEASIEINSSGEENFQEEPLDVEEYSSELHHETDIQKFHYPEGLTEQEIENFREVNSSLVEIDTVIVPKNISGDQIEKIQINSSEEEGVDIDIDEMGNPVLFSNTENHSAGEDGGVDFSEEDNQNIYQEGFGIQNASESEIFTEKTYTFGNLKNADNYDGYISSRGYQYNLDYSRKATLADNYLEAIKIDNSIYLFSTTSYKREDPKVLQKFNGKFIANFVDPRYGRGQSAGIGIVDMDKKGIMSLSLVSYQEPSINYHTRYFRRDLVCEHYSTIDDTLCLNGGGAGNYIVLVYKRSNGKYSKITHKISQNLRGNHTIEYDVDYDSKKIILDISNAGGSNVYKQEIDFSKAKDNDYSDYSGFHYNTRAGTTNNQNQRIYPQEIGLDFGEPSPQEKAIGDVNQNLHIDSLESSSKSVFDREQLIVPITLKDVAYNPDTIEPGDIQYEYSFDGEQYMQFPYQDSGIEINSLGGDEVILEGESEDILSEIRMPSDIGDAPTEDDLYQDNGKISNYENLQEDMGFGIQDDTIIHTDDFNDGSINSFFTYNANNNCAEQSGYLECVQKVTDQRSHMESEWFDVGDSGVVLEFDIWSNPANSYYYGNVTLQSNLDNKATSTFIFPHNYNRYYDRGYRSLKNTVAGKLKVDGVWKTFSDTPGLHKQWVKHKVEIDIVNNIVRHSINGKEKTIETDLSYLDSKKLRFLISPYGWWTGHSIRLDNLKINRIKIKPSGNIEEKNLSIDISDQANGEVSLYVRARSGIDVSQSVFHTVDKAVGILEKPTGLSMIFKNDTAYYSWKDNSHAEKNENKFVLKGVDNEVIIDDIRKDMINTAEKGLTYDSSVKRKICAVNNEGEEYCSAYFDFKTPKLVEHEVYLNRQISYPFQARSYTYSKSGEADISYGTRYDTLYLRGKKGGSMELYAYRGGYHKYTFKLNVLPIPQPQEIDITVNEGEYVYAYLPNISGGYKYYRDSRSQGHAYIYSGSSHNMKIAGHRKGIASYYIYDKTNGFYRYKLNIDVKLKPQIIFSCEVKGGNSCDFNMPKELVGKNLGFTSDRYKIYRIYKGDYSFSIRTNSIQTFANTKVLIYEGRYQIGYVDIKIKPNIPEFHCEILEGGSCTARVNYASAYTIEDTNGGITNTNIYRENVIVSGLKGGENTIYLKYGSSYRAAFHVTVLSVDDIEIPTTECSVYDQARCTIALTSANIFQYTTSNGGIVNVSADSSNFYIQGNNVGKTEVFVKYKGKLVGKVQVTVGTRARTYRCEKNLDGECSFYMGKYLYKYGISVSEGGIVDIARTGNRSDYLTITPKKEGTVKVYVKYKSQYLYQFHLTFKEPSQKNCEILEGEKCSIEGLPKYYNYQLMKDGGRTGRYRRDSRDYGEPTYLDISGTFQRGENQGKNFIMGIMGGDVNLEIWNYSAQFDYQLYDIHTKIHEVDFPAETPLCETRVNGSCQISLRNIGTDKYTYYFSKPGILSVHQKRDYLHLSAIGEGTVEVLVKNNETGVFVHKAEIKVSGKYKVYSPSKFSETEIDLKVGESKIVQILEGNLNKKYRVKKYFPNVSVSYVGADAYKITALSSENTKVKIGFYDVDDEYRSRTVNVNISAEIYEEEKDEETSDNSSDTEIDKELEDDLRKLFEDLGVDYDASVQSSDEVGINSVSYANRCELKRTGSYWVRPNNATCIDNGILDIPWECSIGHEPIFGKGLANTCVTTSFYTIYKKGGTEFSNKLDRVVKLLADHYGKDGIDQGIKSLSKIGFSLSKKFTKTESKGLIQYLIESSINELDKRRSDSTKELQDTMLFWFELQKVRVTHRNHRDIETYEVTQAEFNRMADNFARKLSSLKYEVDKPYALSIDIEVENQKTRGINGIQFASGVKEGPIIATKDFVIGKKGQITDLGDGISNITFSDISNGFSKTITSLKNPQESIDKIKYKAQAEILSLIELGEITINIDENVIPKEDYDKGYFTGYGGTTLALESIPAGKYSLLLGGKVVPDGLKELKRLNNDRKEKKDDEDECTGNNRPKKCLSKLSSLKLGTLNFSDYVSGTDLQDLTRLPGKNTAVYNAIVEGKISVQYPGKTKTSTKEIAQKVDTKYTHVTEDMAFCRMRNLETSDLEKALKDVTEYVNNFGDYGCVKVDDPRGLVELKIGHIMKPDFDTNRYGKRVYTGLHSLYELDESEYVKEVITIGVNEDTEPYKARILVNEDGEAPGKGNNIPREERPHGLGISTMFPDSWSRQKIVDEVTYAIKYNVGKETNTTSSNEYTGNVKLQHEFKINFYFNKGSNGNPDRIGSYFPKID